MNLIRISFVQFQLQRSVSLVNLDIRVQRRIEYEWTVVLSQVHALLSQHLAQIIIRTRWWQKERIDEAVAGCVVCRRVNRLLTAVLRRARQSTKDRRSLIMQLSHVLLQIEVSTKALAANLTRERFLIVMRVHVEGKIVDLMESLVTNIALVRLLSAVGESVIFVVALLVESFTAELAHEGLVIRVDSRVRVQGRATVEGFAAGAALVRLLRRVDDLVPAERARLAEAFAANLADERPDARVHGHVSGEIVMSVKHLAAFRTRERLLLGRVDLARGRTLLAPLRFRCN